MEALGGSLKEPTAAAGIAPTDPPAFMLSDIVSSCGYGGVWLMAQIERMAVKSFLNLKIKTAFAFC